MDQFLARVLSGGLTDIFLKSMAASHMMELSAFDAVPEGEVKPFDVVHVHVTDDDRVNAVCAVQLHVCVEGVDGVNLAC